MQLFVLLAILGAALAAPNTSVRIAGGDDTLIRQYPFFTNVQIGGLGVWVQHCGGSLLSETVVLTAGSCLDGTIASFLRVKVGASAYNMGTVHNVVNYKYHERWNSPTYENDIGLLFLRTRATVSNNVGFARIPGATYTVADDTTVVAVGFGDTKPDENSNPDILQSVEIKVINQQTCAQRYAELKDQPNADPKQPQVTSNMICTGVLDVEGKGWCYGDEGGPVVAEDNIVVGVASWNHRCGDAKVPGISTKVSAYSAWIIENAGIPA
ncbi:hypothetical protein JYU34_013750 [Plutella xylostella]|uniref:Peptidase S1 domain-containing protein n=1 Tax=Plutella xylostella TaxID=51655 RepID=A0ABQ7QAK4_PLUXY|nr:hypothetical protein JYU34_013750 [Plutella xylostella]